LGGIATNLALPNGALPRPMIADTGKIVVRVGNLTNSPILVYEQDLTKTPQAIAGQRTSL
jgi:hypothetical protein